MPCNFKRHYHIKNIFSDCDCDQQTSVVQVKERLTVTEILRRFNNIGANVSEAKNGNTYTAMNIKTPTWKYMKY